MTWDFTLYKYVLLAGTQPIKSNHFLALKALAMGAISGNLNPLGSPVFQQDETTHLSR
jgi:hypothetical protein